MACLLWAVKPFTALAACDLLMPCPMRLPKYTCWILRKRQIAESAFKEAETLTIHYALTFYHSCTIGCCFTILGCGNLWLHLIVTCLGWCGDRQTTSPQCKWELWLHTLGANATLSSSVRCPSHVIVLYTIFMSGNDTLTHTSPGPVFTMHPRRSCLIPSTIISVTFPIRITRMA